VKIFIGWSGDLSKKIAIALKELIPNVLQFTEPNLMSHWKILIREVAGAK
jgi:hypothetical protein